MHPARLPLGGGWNGHCTAPGHEEAVPSEDVLKACCNLGYAASCGWAPAERNSDALRFAVLPPARNGRESGGSSSDSEPARLVHVTYVCERANRPAGHGELQFDLSTATWLRRHEDARIQKMAECFLESYLRKRS